MKAPLRIKLVRPLLRRPMFAAPSLADFASEIIGLKLHDGWTIDEQYKLPDGDSGGTFSLLYKGHNEDGRAGFIKVLNYHDAFTSKNSSKVIQRLTERYNFESEIVKRCSTGRLSRVVKAYAYGETGHPSWGILPVSYIVFELAEGDVRQAFDAIQDVDLATKLRFAHHVATGASQLHALGIAHQDIKPSNVLVFRGEQDTRHGSKLTDLGRASDRNVAAWHDENPIPGDATYVPPEHLYRATPVGFERRRVASDVYQVGNLAAFIITGRAMNARLLGHLDLAHNWHNWRDSYDQVLPYVQNAHAASIQDVAHEIGGPLADRIAALISYLTDPDIEQRGHPDSRRAGQPFALNRIITDFDRLFRDAEVLAVSG
ncbi:protein kinase [Promicromonospora sukumoe]|uniref:protein kinase domain-containing protein n=1 Tax=Promicromonospora sukumoe TaxID=88382 RepID=UPI0037CAC14D